MNRTLVALSLASFLGVGGLVALPARGQTTEELNLTEQEQAQLEEAARLNEDAIELYEQGRYAEAETLFIQALERKQRFLGNLHLSVAIGLNNLAFVYWNQRRYSKAEPLYQQALEIIQQLHKEPHLSVIISLNNLAFLYESQERNAEAETLYQQALDMGQQLLEDPNLNFTTTSDFLDRSQGRYRDAESLSQQVLKMTQRLLGDPHSDFVIILNSLARLYERQGRYGEAQSLYWQVLHMTDRLQGFSHPSITVSLAQFYMSYGGFEDAEPLFIQALETTRKLQVNLDFDIVTSLHSLAILYRDQGKYSEAETLYQQILEINRQSDDSFSIGSTLHSLANLYEKQERYEESERLYQQALEIDRKLLENPNPNFAISRSHFFFLYQTYQIAGNISLALDFLAAAIKQEEHHLQQNLIAGSEQQKQNYLNSLSSNRDTILSLHLHQALNDEKAARLALQTLLQRKGRILDFSTQTQKILRHRLDPESQTLLDHLNAKYSRLSNLTLNPPPNIPPENLRSQINTLNQQIQDLEDQIGRRSHEFRQITQPITLTDIQKRLPQDSVLVEFVQYRVSLWNGFPEHSDKRKPRYAVYIFTPEGKTKGIDLGEVEAIDNNLQLLRFSLRDPNTPSHDIQAIAQTIEQQIITPLRPHLGNAKHLLISPDGNLNTIPFESLIDQDGKYLLETHTLTYLTSGRDLLRFDDAPTTLTPPVIMGNPDFNNPGELLATAPIREFSLSNTRSPQQLNAQTWGLPPIPETETEAIAIADLLNVTPLLKTQASEETLKQIDRPRILHIATHGFFRAKPPSNDPTDNPLLWSGLVLAGMKSEGGAEDGFLTALETTGLRLDGTQLVVLSACDTGLGGLARGEGIYGLRRALVIAGAESQVMSLWKVSDRATQELMVAYYQKLKAGESRSEALRQIKLQMLQGEMNEKYKHPYYWASFIPSGNWSPMQF